MHGDEHSPAAIDRPRQRGSSRRRFKAATWGTRALFGAAALGALQFVHAPAAPTRPFARFAQPRAWASADAFGASREVKLRFALPGQRVEFPLAVAGDPSTLSYQWVPITDSVLVSEPLPLLGSTLEVPALPGFYQLTLIRRGAGDDTTVTRERVAEPTLAVMVPFTAKAGSFLNGYRIGTYLAERFAGERDEPQGFLQVGPAEAGLSVSRHFRLSDFITHDAQADVWPKYVALDPRLLDKLELIVTEVARMRGVPPDSTLELDVHSGFRTPAHNAGVQRAARDSRHQYGDAADVVIDADGDGRITRADSRLVESAVEVVESQHPELVGGLGLYTSERYRTPYVHIDARGRRSRWRG